jgi:hypothetical protein
MSHICPVANTMSMRLPTVAPWGGLVNRAAISAHGGTEKPKGKLQDLVSCCCVSASLIQLLATASPAKRLLSENNIEFRRCCAHATRHLGELSLSLENVQGVLLPEGPIREMHQRSHMAALQYCKD